MTTYDVAIVGAGHGGSQAAIALRQLGFAGRIALISDDANLPYERPPLSKDYLLGEKSFDRLLMRPESFWQERNIDLLLGHEITALDPAARSLKTTAGQTISFDKLVWAAGGETRKLSCDGHDLRGVHSLRSRSDADNLLSELPEVGTAVIIGAGYIGLEAAAALTKLDKQVIVVETQDRVLARVAGEPLSRFLEAEHLRHGVDLRLGAHVECIVGEDHVTGVRLAGGEIIPCELVVVGIGITPALEPLRVAGAQVSNGIEVDECCRTSLPHVFAIGDCAFHPNRFSERGRLRIESVQNATDQATVVAKTIAGQEAAYDALPWFWSNQYDLKLQTVGLADDHDELVVRGDPSTRSFSVIYLKNQRVIALDCINMTKDYVQGRKLILSRAEVGAEVLARTDLRLSDLVQPN